MTKENKRYTKHKTKKRDKDPYPALNPGLNLRTRQDEIEIDYLHKLSKEEAEWLNRFNEEYVNASLDREDLSKNIHSTEKLKKGIDHRNYTRKKDMFTREKASGNLKYINDLTYDDRLQNDHEDNLIDILDNHTKCSI